MTTYYVDPTYGNDSAAGTVGVPWKTWSRLKTFLEGASSRPDEIIILNNITATATIALPSDVTIRGATWHIRPTITGPTDAAVFSITTQDDITLKNLIVTGGSQFVTFSGACLRVKILHCKGSAWTHSTPTSSQWIDAGGGNRAGSQIAYCEGSDAAYDFFSTAGSYNWLIEYNYVHDLALSAPGGTTDAFAFHESKDGSEIVRYNYIKNVYGKAAISLGISTGSVGEVYGNYIESCLIGITAAGNVDTDVQARCNVVVTTTISSGGTPIGNPSSYGIGTAAGDSLTASFECYNNLVYNSSTASSIYCYRFDTTIDHRNNVAIVANATAGFWIISAVASGFANTFDYNCYWSTNGTEGSRFVVDGVSSFTLAQIQALSRETNSFFADPNVRTLPPTKIVDAMPAFGSRLRAAGVDLSAKFTTDAMARVISGAWPIGPLQAPLNAWVDHAITIQVVEDEITCIV